VSKTTAALVVGLGNRLLSDDSAGPLVIDRLCTRAEICAKASLIDGGTIGLGLLPSIESGASLIAIDAARFGAAPGTVRVFEGEDMDRQIGARGGSVHELALTDLIAAAALSGTLPQRRALVAVEPGSTAPGSALSDAVDAAIPLMCEQVDRLLARWVQ
jgi:hydrogenase maturation protease